VSESGAESAEGVQARLGMAAYPGATEEVALGALASERAYALMRRFALQQCPDLICAFAFGSISREAYRPYSDLDLVIVAPSGASLERRCVIFQGAPIESHQFGLDALPIIVREARRSGNSFVLTPLATGVCLEDPLGVAAEVGRRAAHALAAGPDLPARRLDEARYALTNQLLDLAGDLSPDERFACAMTLYPLLLEVLFFRERVWRYRGKWVARGLADVEPAFMSALQEAYSDLQKGDAGALLGLGEALLDSVGGALWAGYSQTAVFNARG
jgi:Nucleotidyltransferase domain